MSARDMAGQADFENLKQFRAVAVYEGFNLQLYKGYATVLACFLQLSSCFFRGWGFIQGFIGLGF